MWRGTIAAALAASGRRRCARPLGPSRKVGHGWTTRRAQQEPADAEPPSPQAAQDHPRRRAARRACRPEPRAPHVEEIAAEGLRWVKIDDPTAVEQAWLEEHFDFHALDFEDVLSRNQRPKIDKYDDYLFIVLHFPVFDSAAGRLGHRRARPLRRPRLPDHDPEPAAAAGRVPVRALPPEGGAARAALLARLRLPALPDRRRRLRLLLPDAAQDRQQARRAGGGDLRGHARRRSSATSPTSSRRSSTSAR